MFWLKEIAPVLNGAGILKRWVIKHKIRRNFSLMMSVFQKAIYSAKKVVVGPTSSRTSNCEPGVASGDTVTVNSPR